MTKSFIERPYWVPFYAENFSCVLDNIPGLLKCVKSFVDDKENQEYVDGYMTYHRTRYITESNQGENTGTQTVSETDIALLDISSSERNYRKTKNLSAAIDYVFGKSIFGDIQHPFTTELAKNVNKLIGEGLFKAGSYRLTDAKPSGYDFFYTRANDIEERLNNLFKEVSSRMKCLKCLNLCERISIASKFLAEFLLIHPFHNGNGRTARLLLSYLFIKYTIVPVSLFSPLFDGNRNSVYLDCLRSAQIYHDYRNINSLIIQSIHISLLDIIVALDIT